MQYVEDLVAHQQWPGSLQQNNPGNIIFKFNSKAGYDLLKAGGARNGVYINMDSGDNLNITIPGTIVEGGGFQLQFAKR